MICIGYAGEEAYDVILYISRTFTKLDYEVLLIDVSDSNALCKSINHGMELDSEHNVVSYRDINYVRHMLTDEELIEFNNGVVIVVYGYNLPTQITLPCKEMIVVLNTFPHIIDRINNMMMNANVKNCITHILIRDIMTADDVERVKNAIKFQYKEETTNSLYMDFGDYECAVNCQITQSMQFTDISTGLKKYIIEIIHSMLPEFKPYHIKKAINMARRGR